MKKEKLDYIDLKEKYKRRLSKDLKGKDLDEKQVTTADYESFKKTFMPKNLTYYENICNFTEKIFPIKPDKATLPSIQEAIRVSHLNISPTGVYSFAITGGLVFILATILLGYVLPALITSGESAENFFFIYFGLLMGIGIIIPLTKLPFIISNFWRMKASNQMVLSIFYIVTYMRHTPNLELAVDFAAEHLSAPLSLDFKKVIWDIETGKFDNVTQSLDFYLETWREYNPEFIESMHLIQSSLYESSDDRRQRALDKALDVILDETYEKMLHYTHDLKSPITTLHMLGIILPILGLVILPLLVAFVPEARWYHLFALYNVALPIFVYYLGRDILSKRPTGYGGVDANIVKVDEQEQNVVIRLTDKSKIKLTPIMTGLFIFGFFIFIGLIPLILHASNPNFDVALTEEGILYVQDIDPGVLVYGKLLDYRITLTDDFREELNGPFGLGASLLSLALPLAFALGYGYYNKLKTKDLVKLRDDTKNLEQEFASALFQLGNRLGDGIPAEIAFSNVASVMKGTKSGRFFDMVSTNIVKLGMGVEEAIFDKDVGALKSFPSSIIESSMKVFLQSSKKGPLITSQAILTVAEYIKSMHRVDERLQDLMADIISNMKSQISFLTPTISGVVVGITSLISSILGALSDRLQSGFASGDLGSGGIQGIMELFEGGGIPTYYFQAVVGLYIVQITYIMTILINGIQNGTDKIGEQDMLGNNLIKSVLLYFLISSGCIIAFSFMAITVVGAL